MCLTAFRIADASFASEILAERFSITVPRISLKNQTVGGCADTITAVMRSVQKFNYTRV